MSEYKQSPMRDVMQKRVVDNLNRFVSADDLKVFVEARTGRLIADADAELILARRLETGFYASFDEIVKVIGDNPETLELVERALDDLEPKNLTEDGPSTRIASRGLGPVSVMAYTIPSEQGPIEIPRRPPPEEDIPRHPTWRIPAQRGEVIDQVPWTDDDGCRFTYWHFRDRRVGPMQTAEEYLWDIVIVEPTGSSISSEVGVTGASAGVSSPSYVVVQMRVCIQLRWQLEKTWTEKYIEKVCPPDFERELLRHVVSEKQTQWVQLKPVFPFPCGRTVIATVGGGMDPYSRAKELADQHARAQEPPLGRFEGILQDRDS